LKGNINKERKQKKKDKKKGGEKCARANLAYGVLIAMRDVPLLLHPLTVSNLHPRLLPSLKCLALDFKF
jgi:hypothetical protein